MFRTKAALPFFSLSLCLYVSIVVWLAVGGSGGSLFIRSGAAWRGVMPTTIGRGSRNGRNGPKGERGRIRRSGWSRGVTARERDGSEVSAVTGSPLHTPVHATSDFVVPRTFLCRWLKELGWVFKIRSHESKWLLAQVNRNQTIIHSCSPGPRVTLIHDSYFWALIQALSVKRRKRVQKPTESCVALRSYSRDWSSFSFFPELAMPLIVWAGKIRGGRPTSCSAVESVMCANEAVVR